MKKLLVIVGPTGTGKSSLALQLAEKYNGELVSADSRQIYIGMDIGTGKEIEDQKTQIKKFESYWTVNDIPIHLYDVISPDRTFSVATYQQLAYKVINDAHTRGKLPILVGGTGLFVRAVVDGLKIPKIAPDLKLRKKLESKSVEVLAAELEKVDPETASKIDNSNPRRIIRALEVCYLSGESFSKLKGKFKTEFETLKIGLTSERVVLTSMTSLGYRQVGMYLRKKISLDETKQRIKWERHGYIRRQLTWFRKEPNIAWFDISKKGFKEKIANAVKNWIS